MVCLINSYLKLMLVDVLSIKFEVHEVNLRRSGNVPITLISYIHLLYILQPLLCHNGQNGNKL